MDKDADMAKWIASLEEGLKRDGYLRMPDGDWYTLEEMTQVEWTEGTPSPQS